MDFRRGIKYIAVPAVIMSGVGFAIYVGAAQAQGPGGANMPPPEVSVITVQQEKVTLTTELPGRTSGFNVSEIRPQVSGLIQKRLFTEGSDVKAGDVLYQIDPAPFQAAHDSAAANLDSAQKTAEKMKAMLNASIANVEREKATVELAKTDCKRAEDLFKDKAVSASERDHAVTALDVAKAALLVSEADVDSSRAGIASAQAAVKQAEAAVTTAKINLGYTKITAPISGRIGRSNVTEGAVVTAYQPLALSTIQQLDPIYVDVTQSTADVAALRTRIEKGHLKSGDTDQNMVKLIMEDNSEYPLEGALAFRDVTVDQTTGSIILRITVPNPNSLLLPGMFMRAAVEEGFVEKAILVPQQAVSRDSKGNPVAMIVNGENKVEPRPLVVEREIGDKWLVTAGLAVGDNVIVEGLLKARPGAAVKSIPYDASPKAAAPPSNTPQSAPKSK
jgi:membrane fusion protein (multidrug efflux system)